MTGSSSMRSNFNRLMQNPSGRVGRRSLNPSGLHPPTERQVSSGRNGGFLASTRLQRASRTTSLDGCLTRYGWSDTADAGLLRRNGKTRGENAHEQLLYARIRPLWHRRISLLHGGECNGQLQLSTAPGKSPRPLSAAGSRSARFQRELAVVFNQLPARLRRTRIHRPTEMRNRSASGGGPLGHHRSES